ncbi:MAG: polysaccharide deacetylase family protein, partial [Acidimicrobiales bacterium]
MDEPRGSGASRWGRGLATTALVAGTAQYLPSTVVLGQWGPWRSLPGGLCRWSGPDRGAVALTFDDGPDPKGTPAVLDKLDELHLRATFFVVGSCAELAPDLVEEIARRGHQIGTHGYAHEHHLARTPRWVVRDLKAAMEVMDGIGTPVTWYRPSFGQATGSTLAAARRLGLETVLWSAWGREWTTTDSHEVAARITRRLRGGAIVLLHDSDRFGTPGMWRTGLAALDEVALRLDERSLATVTLDQLVTPPGAGVD